MRIELQRPYPSVLHEGTASCGGNQEWFPDGNFRRCGCGVIAAADVLSYLRGVYELPREDYIRYVCSLRRRFPLIPHRGIDGVRLAAGLNACLRDGGIPVRARWCASGAKFWDRLAEMLADDLPAILAVGPNFPRFWGGERLSLYRRTEYGICRAMDVKGHFLTAVALDDAWIEASSWGKRFLIERRAYEAYMQKNGALFTNLLRLERI